VDQASPQTRVLFSFTNFLLILHLKPIIFHFFNQYDTFQIVNSANVKIVLISDRTKDRLMHFLGQQDKAKWQGKITGVSLYSPLACESHEPTRVVFIHLLGIDHVEENRCIVLFILHKRYFNPWVAVVDELVASHISLSHLVSRF
jgi:hypothetical protein